MSLVLAPVSIKSITWHQPQHLTPYDINCWQKCAHWFVCYQYIFSSSISKPDIKVIHTVGSICFAQNVPMAATQKKLAHWSKKFHQKLRQQWFHYQAAVIQWFRQKQRSTHAAGFDWTPLPMFCHRTLLLLIPLRPQLHSTMGSKLWFGLKEQKRWLAAWTVWGQWGLCDTEEDWEGCSSLQPVSTVKHPAHNFWTQVAAHFVTDYPSRGNACKETCCSLTFAGHLSYSFPTDGR